MCTWNARGVIHHKLELELFLQEEDISVICLSETSLKPGKYLRLPGYTIYTHDRTTGVEGGVAIEIRSTICSTPVYFSCELEAVGADLEYAGSKLRLMSIYKHPNTAVVGEDFTKLLSVPNTLLGGDFNCKNPAWGSRRTYTHGR